MVSRLRKHLSYTHLALSIALVFAMTGGAYAASKYLITSTKQIKPSVLAQLKGKSGAKGAQGAQGAQGVQGPKGETGPAGAKGETGPAGAKGENGTNGATGPTGPKGVAGTTGPTGPTGPTGSPWTPGTLPSGATETGVFSVAALPAAIVKGIAEYEFVYVPISFAVPLKSGLSETHVHVIAANEKGTGGKTCPTTSSATKPEAEAGNLCIFMSNQAFDAPGSATEVDNAYEGSKGAGTTGAYLLLHPASAEQNILATGTWAVTAE